MKNDINKFELKLISEKWNIDNISILKLFFRQNLIGAYLVMFEKSVEWSSVADKDATVEYIFNHSNIIDINNAMLNQYSMTEKEIIGKTLGQFFTHKPERGKRLCKELFENGQIHVESHRHRKDGTIIWLEGDYSCIYDDKGRIIGTFGFQQDITEHKKTKNLNHNLSTIMKYISDSVIITDKNFKITYINKKAEELFGYKQEELLGKTTDILNAEPTAAEIQKEIYDTITDGKSYLNEALNRRKDGTTFICEFKISPILGEEGLPYLYVGIQRDVTEKKKIENTIYNEKEHFKTTLLSVGDGVISTDEFGCVNLMNPIAEKFTGWTQAEACGRPLDEIFYTVNEHTREPCENPAKLVLQNKEITELSNNTLLISKDGEEIPIEDSAAPIRDSTGNITGVVIVFRDFTEKREKQRQIEYLSFHDHLTGLYNRRYIEDTIKRLDTDRNLPFTVMVIDVNGLKLTNDAFGHEMGDKLLITVSEIMKKVCRADDIIGRMGGDEFIILLPHVDHIQADKIKHRIIKEASVTKLDSVIVSLAIGYAVKTNIDQDINIIITASDNNMYKDKIKYGKIMRSKTIEMVLRNINLKYDQEQIHTERVSQYSEAIARVLNLNEIEIEEIKTAAVLHDIGKIMVPSELLNKHRRLTKEEFEAIKKHPETGYQILRSVNEYAKLAEGVLYHHEHWDGNGYPEGLKGEEIPLLARIIAVADAYEAMTANRPYQDPKTKQEAKEELIRCAGSQFDPKIVRIFIENVL